MDKKNSGSVKLYHDAGEGFSYQQGDYSLITFRAEKDKQGKTVVLVSNQEGKRKIKPIHTVIHLVTRDKVIISSGDIHDGIIFE